MNKTCSLANFESKLLSKCINDSGFKNAKRENKYKKLWRTSENIYFNGSCLSMSGTRGILVKQINR